MAKSKQDRILEQFLNEQRKKEYRQQKYGYDPLSEQRESHTIQYEQPSHTNEEEIGTTIDFYEALAKYGISKKEADQYVSDHIDEAKDNEESFDQIFDNFNDSTKDPLEEQAKAHTIQYEEPKHDQENTNDENTINFFDVAKPEDFENSNIEEPVVSQDDAQMGEEQTVDQVLDDFQQPTIDPIEEQAQDHTIQYEEPSHEQENVNDGDTVNFFDVVKPEELENAPVEDNVQVEEPVVVEPSVEEPVVQPETVINNPGEEYVRPVEPEGHGGSFTFTQDDTPHIEEETDEEEGYVPPANNNNLRATPEDLKRWIDLHEIEGSLSNPQYASYFSKIKDVERKDGVAIMNLDSSKRVFVAGDNVQFCGVTELNGKTAVPTLNDCLTMVRMGQMKGWDFATIDGSDEFKKQMYIACRVLGMPTKDFVPTPEMIMAADEACSQLQSPDKLGHTINDYVADLDNRYPKIQAKHADEPAEPKLVEKYSKEGLGPFNKKLVAAGNDKFKTTTDDKDKEDKEKEEKEYEAFKTLSLDEKIDKVGLIPGKDGKLSREQSDIVKECYDRDFAFTESVLNDLQRRQAEEKYDAKQAYSDKTKASWEALDAKINDKKELTEEEKKDLANRDKFYKMCEEREISPDEVNVPEKLMTDESKKGLTETRRNISANYMGATEAVKEMLAKKTKEGVENPSSMAKPLANEFDGNMIAVYTSGEFAGPGLSDKLKAVGKMRSKNKELDVATNKQFAKMSKDGDTLTGYHDYKKGSYAEEASKQFSSEVKRNILGQYKFRDSAR
ncbi:MAG: hypothetical protein MJ247_05585 [Alphaproteobacteria bacterium]|nr:hypothetical protein [Alphaproteobacteria bacterium]